MIALAVTAYAAVGLVVDLARPGHLVGRLMLLGAVTWGVGEALLGWGLAGLADGPTVSTNVLLGVLGTALRGLGWLVLVLALPLVFPDGRAPWRGAGWLAGGCVAAFTLATLLPPVPLEERLEDHANPIGLPAAWDPVTSCWPSARSRSASSPSSRRSQDWSAAGVTGRSCFASRSSSSAQRSHCRSACSR